jgi:Holliday junction resolvase RusA-like endonuclease
MKFEIPLKTVPKGRPRAGRDGHFYTPEATRSFEDALRFQLQLCLPPGWEMFMGRLNVNIGFLPDATMIEVFERVAKRRKGAPAGDIDNLGKAVMDSCNGLLWKDDRQIDALMAWR